MINPRSKQIAESVPLKDYPDKVLRLAEELFPDQQDWLDFFTGEIEKLNGKLDWSEVEKNLIYMNNKNL